MRECVLKVSLRIVFVNGIQMLGTCWGMLGVWYWSRTGTFPTFVPCPNRHWQNCMLGREASLWAERIHWVLLHFPPSSVPRFGQAAWIRGLAEQLVYLWEPTLPSTSCLYFFNQSHSLTYSSIYHSLNDQWCFTANHEPPMKKGPFSFMYLFQHTMMPYRSRGTSSVRRTRTSCRMNKGKAQRGRRASSRGPGWASARGSRTPTLDSPRGNPASSSEWTG
jgi:hypothetical protein